jgi:hypothetical protein
LLSYSQRPWQSILKQGYQLVAAKTLNNPCQGVQGSQRTPWLKLQDKGSKKTLKFSPNFES